MPSIYFAAPIRGAGRDPKLVREVVLHLKELGCDVVTEDYMLSATPEDPTPDPEVFERDMSLLRTADALIADVTYPSLGVGYEICEAVHLGKPVMAFYRRGVRVSKLVLGNPMVVPTPFSDLEELKSAIKDFLERLRS